MFPHHRRCRASEELDIRLAGETPFYWRLYNPSAVASHKVKQVTGELPSEQQCSEVEGNIYLSIYSLDNLWVFGTGRRRRRAQRVFSPYPPVHATNPLQQGVRSGSFADEPQASSVRACDAALLSILPKRAAL
jgi:hypothetical protein